MSYEERFELVKYTLIIYCKNCVRDNWEQMFDMWLSVDAGTDFGHGYINKFKQQFTQYMNSNIEDLLYTAGRNIKFAICTFMNYNKNAKLNDVLKFTEYFVSEQLDDFKNWCDKISQAMYEETSEYEREFGGDRNDENPQ